MTVLHISKGCQDLQIVQFYWERPRNLMCFGKSRIKFVHNVNIFPKISRGQECDYPYVGQGQEPVLSP
jgi:hypothetical protein